MIASSDDPWNLTNAYYFGPICPVTHDPAEYLSLKLETNPIFSNNALPLSPDFCQFFPLPRSDVVVSPTEILPAQLQLNNLRKVAQVLYSNGKVSLAFAAAYLNYRIQKNVRRPNLEIVIDLLTESLRYLRRSVQSYEPVTFGILQGIIDRDLVPQLRTYPKMSSKIREQLAGELLCWLNESGHSNLALPFYMASFDSDFEIFGSTLEDYQRSGFMRQIAMSYALSGSSLEKSRRLIQIAQDQHPSVQNLIGAANSDLIASIRSDDRGELTNAIDLISNLSNINPLEDDHDTISKQVERPTAVGFQLYAKFFTISKTNSNRDQEIDKLMIEQDRVESELGTLTSLVIDRGRAIHSLRREIGSPNFAKFMLKRLRQNLPNDIAISISGALGRIAESS